jgi:hypothetical protein
MARAGSQSPALLPEVRNMSGSGAIAAIGIFVAAGCSAERMPAPDQEMYAGKISGDWPHGNTVLRIAYGKHWVVGGDVAANSMGEFRVPSSARAVVAYIDANHNGKFDRFAEPSGDCQLTDHEWKCSILLQRTTLHRAIMMRNDRHSDKMYIFWEDFRSDGTRIDDSRLCIGQRCTHLDRGPFLSRSKAEVQEFSICENEGVLPQDANIRIPGHSVTVHVAQPAKFDVFMNTQPSKPAGGELRLYIGTPSIDRVLIWGGSLNHQSDGIKNVYWSSEDANIPIIDTQSGIEARIPFFNIQVCQQDPDCEIVVQLLKYWSFQDAQIASATEYRSTLNFRRHP